MFYKFALTIMLHQHAAADPRGPGKHNHPVLADRVEIVVPMYKKLDIVFIKQRIRDNVWHRNDL